MRGDEEQQQGFMVLESLQDRVPAADHPPRPIRCIVNKALGEISSLFDSLYPQHGCLSISPECLLRAQVLQILYAMPSERRLWEHLEFKLLFRWLVACPSRRKSDTPRASPRTGTVCSPRR